MYRQFTITQFIFRGAFALTFSAAALMSTACSNNESTPPSKAGTFYGASQAIGSGNARTYVTLDADGKPTAIGVSLTEGALTNLPTTTVAPNPSALTLNLALPEKAPVQGYDHIMLDWNPNGHEPEHVYTLPHFDFHFYQVSDAEVMAIVPTDPQYAAKAASFPAAQFVPAGYAAASDIGKTTPVAAIIPMMGLHWLEKSSPELQPPPAGKPFTETFIYGSYDGKFIFIEPMITKAYLESIKGTNGMQRNVGTPAQVALAGYYPTAYSIRYDATAKEYHVALENLTFRQ